MSWPLCHWSRNAAILTTSMPSIFDRREVLRHDHKVPVAVSLAPSIIARHLTDSCCDRYNIVLNNLRDILGGEVIACDQFPININPFTLIDNILVSSTSHEVVSIDWYPARTLKNVWTGKSVHN